MKPLNCWNWSGRRRSLIPPAVIISTFAALCLLMQEPLWAGGTVTDCTEASLRAAMAGGGTITFACDGTITLTGTITNSGNTTLDGTGHQISISGGNVVRIFYVATNSTLAMTHLTLNNGQSRNGTNGVYCGPMGQPSPGGPGEPGGGIFNAGSLPLRRVLRYFV